MTEHGLYDTTVHAAFQQTRRKRVAQCVKDDGFDDPGFPRGLFEKPGYLAGRKMFTALATRTHTFCVQAHLCPDW